MMADKVEGKLCDYGSSMDESGDEVRRISESQARDPKETTSSSSSPTSSGIQSDEKDISPKVDSKMPRQYCEDIHDFSCGGSSSRRSKHGRSSRRDRRSRSRSCERSRRSYRRRDRSREHRRDHDHHSHRRRRTYGREVIRRRRREDKRHRSSSSSSPSDGRRAHHSSRHGRERETAFSRKIIGSRSELAKVQEAVRPVDPIAAKLEAVNKASAIMASAVKPSESTPQEVLARIQATQMTQVRAKAEAAAAAANLPSFYNPMSVNAAKLAEQQQKRKLLWSRKSDPVAEAKERIPSSG
ncbi:arginine:serine rich coiled coil protein 2 [Echinococcus multilocularis]|uniref:Arginine:serine rich coiled coil protein 2 n=1 Tax=Echinococcus multilocularis TaxID=6211 RepID=A0A087W223_ECHMU|nr:arginine:serine rich coiled coil protein 2 [Echinococcus multilocularis]